MPSTITMQAGFPVQIAATYNSNVISYFWSPSNTPITVFVFPTSIVSSIVASTVPQMSKPMSRTAAECVSAPTAR